MSNVVTTEKERRNPCINYNVAMTQYAPKGKNTIYRLKRQIQNLEKLNQAKPDNSEEINSEILLQKDFLKYLQEQYYNECGWQNFGRFKKQCTKQKKYDTVMSYENICDPEPPHVPEPTYVPEYDDYLKYLAHHAGITNAWTDRMTGIQDAHHKSNRDIEPTLEEKRRTMMYLTGIVRTRRDNLNHPKLESLGYNDVRGYLGAIWKANISKIPLTMGYMMGEMDKIKLEQLQQAGSAPTRTEAQDDLYLSQIEDSRDHTDAEYNDFDAKTREQLATTMDMNSEEDALLNRALIRIKIKRRPLNISNVEEEMTLLRQNDGVPRTDIEKAVALAISEDFSINDILDQLKDMRIRREPVNPDHFVLQMFQRRPTRGGRRTRRTQRRHTEKRKRLRRACSNRKKNRGTCSRKRK